ncbi:MAG TPA: MFS transporter [Acidobacteriota bacterium]|nr:MFS transporter [Acidobacteriota bacterium]
MATVLTRQQKTWRYRVFATAWLAYAGFYLCRLNFSVAMPLMVEDLGYTKLNFATVISLYSLLYALGQFVSGAWVDRYGPRLVVSIGLCIAVFSNLLMGISASLLAFAVLGGLNGIGQSTGWPGLVKNMTPWFRQRERGVVMAWWGTSYVLGASFAVVFATFWAVDATVLQQWQWRRAFWAPALLLMLIAIIYMLGSRNSPSDAGVPELTTSRATDAGTPSSSNDDLTDSSAAGAGPVGTLAGMLLDPGIWPIAAMYFFLKMTRYSFLFWLPLYMTEHIGYEAGEAGYTAALYELVGFVGAIGAGYVSDRLLNARRYPVGAVMLWALGLVCLLQPLAATGGRLSVAVWIAAVGIFTYGPDTLMSGAAAQDVGSAAHAGKAAGVINGVGSFGQLCSPFIVAYVTEAYGWDQLFYLFVILAWIGAALLTARWNYAPAGSPQTMLGECP